MGLDEYHRKRRFDATPEPRGKLRRRRGRSFVIQKHRATRLHYDLRLEMEGVLRSWAIPKGPSLDPREKRLALQTEDHPVDYGGFEGVIPKGNYGAGEVIVWDRGAYAMVDPETPEEGWKQRKFHFVLAGTKLQGEWVLVKAGSEEKQWLFFKVSDEFASSETIVETRPESVISGLEVADIGGDLTEPPLAWHSKVERELERLGIKTAARVPFPTSIPPMLTGSVDQPFDDEDWLFEMKLDGIRAVAYKDRDTVDLLSRNQKSLSEAFPSLVEAIRLLPANALVMDGEIVAFDEDGRSRFSLIQPRIHLRRQTDVRKSEGLVPAFFHAFDLVYLNGYSLRDRRLEDRKALLRSLVPDEGWIRYTDHVSGRGRDFFRAAAEHGLEGIVAKKKDSHYHSGRSRQWLKVKTKRTEEFVVVGFTPPSGSRKFFGALVLGLYDSHGQLVYVGRAGAGFSAASLKTTYAALKPLVRKRTHLGKVPPELSKAVWVKPDLVCEIRFNDWTADAKLRGPVFERFREDIDPKSCLLEAEAADSSSDAGGAGAESVSLTNLSKVFWPEDELTKGDLIHYYGEIAPTLGPYLQDRPLVLKRYPDGIHGAHFYQKDAPDHTPDWLRVETLWSEDARRDIRYFVGADRDLLVYLANLAAITMNPWSSRIGRLEHPDYVIFDLDPVEGVPYRVVQKVALELGQVLEELELRGYPKTSGASGIHVYLPLLEERFTYREVRVFAEAVASIVVERVPRLATIERVVARRPRQVYIDFLQNVKGKTVASVFSPRARPGAPVSMPLRWGELRRPIDPVKFNLRNVFRRLKRMGDLFSPVLTDRQDIRPFLDALG